MRFSHILKCIVFIALLSLAAPHLRLDAQSMGDKLAYGDTFYGTITPDSSASLWEFQGKANDVALVTVTRLSGNWVPVVTLNQEKSSKGSPSTTSATMSDDKSTATITLTLPEDSPYQVLIKGAAKDFGEFKLTLAGPKGADSPLQALPTAAPSNNTATTAKIGGTYTVFRTEIVGMSAEAPSTVTEGQFTLTPGQIPATYQMTWAFGGTRFIGTAINQGDFLAVAYGDKGCTTGLYYFNDRDGLDARWSEVGLDSKTPGMEHLSRLGGYKRDRITGGYALIGKNPDDPQKTYTGSVNINEWGTYLTFDWHFGKDLITGLAIRKGNLIALEAGNASKSIKCGVMAFTIKDDGTLDGTGMSTVGAETHMNAFPESAANPTKLLTLVGDYTVSRGESGSDPAAGKLSIKPNLFTYDVAWTFTSGSESGVGLRLGNDLAIASGPKACIVLTQQTIIDNFNYESQFAALGDVISLNLGWVDLTKITPLNANVDFEYAAKLSNENLGSYISGSLEVSKAADGFKTMWHFGTNTYDGVGLQQGDLFYSVMPLGQDKACSLRVLHFNDDGSYTGTEISMQSQVAVPLKGTAIPK